jgi:hypothetical protein
LPEVIEEPTGERAAQKEERKNQHEVRDALRHEPARQRPEEIANARVFAPGQEIEAIEAADVNGRSPRSLLIRVILLRVSLLFPAIAGFPTAW